MVQMGENSPFACRARCPHLTLYWRRLWRCSVRSTKGQRRRCWIPRLRIERNGATTFGITSSSSHTIEGGNLCCAQTTPLTYSIVNMYTLRGCCGVFFAVYGNFSMQCKILLLVTHSHSLVRQHNVKLVPFAFIEWHSPIIWPLHFHLYFACLTFLFIHVN